MAENKKGMDSQFVQALQYIGPRLFAQLLGGNEAANITDQMLKGIESSQRASGEASRRAHDSEWRRRMDVANLQLKQQTLQAKKESAGQRDTSRDTDYGQYIHKATKAPVGFHKPTQTFFKLGTKEKVPAHEVMDEGIFRDTSVGKRQSQRLTQRGEHFGKTFGLKEEKAKELSGKQVEMTAAFQKALNQVDRVRELKKHVKTGFFEGRWAKAKAATVGDPKTSRLLSATTKMTADYIFAVSGKAATDAERKLLENVVPKLEDDDPDFEAKLELFQLMLRDGGEIFLNAVKTGQPLKRPQIEKLLKLTERIQQEGATQQAAPQQEAKDFKTLSNEEIFNDPEYQQWIKSQGL